MKKSELRKIYLDRRLALTPELRHQYEAEITGSFFEETPPPPGARVHCYISVADRGEVSTVEIFRVLWEQRPDVETFAPRSDLTTGAMEAVVYTANTPLDTNRWNIAEPVGTETIEPEQIDVVIVPLLCFDRAGHRVGYGKGFYDRFLQKCRPDCIKAGLGFFPPVDRIDEVHEGDIGLDLCITPDRTFRFTSV